jgi:hypothetical protein
MKDRKIYKNSHRNRRLHLDRIAMRRPKPYGTRQCPMVARHVTCRDAAIWLRLGTSGHCPDIANRSLVNLSRHPIGPEYPGRMTRSRQPCAIRQCICRSLADCAFPGGQLTGGFQYWVGD